MLAVEWLDPLFIGGHWVPQLIEYAGGEDVLGFAGEPSEVVDWEVAAATKPDLVLVMPCGRTADQARDEALDHYDKLAALGADRIIIAVEANAYFSRARPPPCRRPRAPQPPPAPHHRHPAARGQLARGAVGVRARRGDGRPASGAPRGRPESPGSGQRLRRRETTSRSRAARCLQRDRYAVPAGEGERCPWPTAGQLCPDRAVTTTRYPGAPASDNPDLRRCRLAGRRPAVGGSIRKPPRFRRSIGRLRPHDGRDAGVAVSLEQARLRQRAAPLPAHLEVERRNLGVECDHCYPRRTRRPRSGRPAPFYAFAYSFACLCPAQALGGRHRDRFQVPAALDGVLVEAADERRERFVGGGGATRGSARRREPRRSGYRRPSTGARTPRNRVASRRRSPARARR